ncbi:MAG: hypothetical protein HYZ50_26985 [Deltaproteobacteria bacterium]|nr:hypothetical protein [Deltaproteobacteria bacterium]
MFVFHIRRLSCAAGIAAVALMATLSASSVLAQPFGAGSGESNSSDMSRSPFKIMLRGVINPDEEEGGRIIKLGIADYQATYPFELVKVEAVDDPQTSEYAILQQAGKFDADFSLIGPKALLSKIGQAEPGTPLKIIGYFQQRARRLQLESVEIMGMEN